MMNTKIEIFLSTINARTKQHELMEKVRLNILYEQIQFYFKNKKIISTSAQGCDTILHIYANTEENKTSSSTFS